MQPVSIIVPFRGDLKQLALCLTGIGLQDYPHELVRVFAVDNSEAGGPVPLARDFPEVCWLSERQPGSYAARNRALAEIRDGYVAFTDSDCVPQPLWIANGVRALRKSTASIVGGKVELMPPVGRALNPYEVFEERMFGMSNQRKLIEKNGFAATANLFTHADVLAAVGPFDARLRSSGDKEWCQRAVKLGHKLAYADEAVVLHPRRSTFGAIYKKSMRLVGGKMTLMRSKGEPWWRIAQDIYFYSLLNHRLHAYALFNSRMSGLAGKCHFFMLVEFMSMCATLEKLRVLCGGTASRG